MRYSGSPESLVGQGETAFDGTGRNERRLTHNPKVAGSNPAPATILTKDGGPFGARHQVDPDFSTGASTGFSG